MLLLIVFIKYLVLISLSFGKFGDGLRRIDWLLGRFEMNIFIDVIDFGLILIEWDIWVIFVLI